MESAMENLLDVQIFYVICPHRSLVGLKDAYGGLWGSRVRFIDESIFGHSKSAFYAAFQESILARKNYRINNYTLPEVTFKMKYGWYLQQIIKLEAGSKLDLEDYVLLDSDLIWFTPQRLLHSVNAETGVPTYNYAVSMQNNPGYRDTTKLLTGLKRKGGFKSGVVHHMVIVKEVLQDLHRLVASRFGRKPFYHAMSNVTSSVLCSWGEGKRRVPMNGHVMSEYDLYFTFAQYKRPETVHFRQLLWANGPKASCLWAPRKLKVDSVRRSNNWVCKGGVNTDTFARQRRMDQLLGWDMIGYHSYATRRYYEIWPFNKTREACRDADSKEYRPTVVPDTTCSWENFNSSLHSEKDWFRGCLCFQFTHTTYG